jgi:hypothetical protein
MMKLSFLAGLLGSLVGVAALLVILLATGLVGAQGPIDGSGESGDDSVTVQERVLTPTGGGGPNAPVGTVFSYQGQLKIGGAPFTGNCDMQFTLWNGTSTSGISITTVFAEPSPVAVANGLFVAYMDFGDHFKGDYRAIQPRVRCPAGVGLYQTLPDQVIYPVPYAMTLRAGATISGDVASNVLNVTNSDASGRAAYLINTGLNATLRADNLGSSGGLAIYGVSEKYNGIQGDSHVATGAGLVGFNSYITGTALLLSRGGIRAASAGLNTDTPVFIQQVQTGAGGNICSGNSYVTVIDNPLINGRSDAILIITPNSGTFGPVAPAPSHPVAVLYDGTNACGFGAGRWAIYDTTNAALVNNQRFNVLVVLP